MSFFYNAAKTEAVAKKPVAKPKRGVIPIASLRSLSCSVCPRSEDKTLKHPKLAPTGTKRPSVYMLGSYPNADDDRTGEHWSGDMGAELYHKFGRNFMDKHVRSGYVTQCKGEQTQVEIECCHDRVAEDIGNTKPMIIVTIGDAALRWATGLSGSALQYRGTWIVTNIAGHTCFVYPMLFPNYIGKKSKGYGSNEYELTFQHDARNIIDAVTRQMPEPRTYHKGPYDEGIEIVMGDQPGDLQRLEKALVDLARETKVTIDIETNGLRPHMMKDPKILTCAVGTFNRVIAFPLDHPDGWATDAHRARAWGLLGAFLLGSGRKTAHNVGFEMEWLQFEFGPSAIRLTEWDDTMAMAHTFDERPGTKSLNNQTRIHFGFFLKDQSRIDTKRLLEYPLKEVLKYNGMDTKWTDKLRDELMLRFLFEGKVQYAEYERKVRLAPTLILTEAIGMPVDFPFAEDLKAKLSTTATKIEKQIQRCDEVIQYGRRFGSFSPTNPDHVLKLMKDICERPEVRVEDPRDQQKAVRWTTDEEALAKIPANEVPSASLILEHRGVSKLLSTYVLPVIERKIVCPDDRIRCKYGSMVAVTTRLNSEDPNIQNWPKRKHKEIRGMVRSPKGRVFTACDYGQIEFRVVGMASEDRNLVKYCWTGYDVHKYWAERMVAKYGPIKDYIVETFNVDWDEKGLKTLRQEAKNGWVFPQLFGSSVKSCAEQLHLPQSVAEDLADEFWDEFPDVKRWQEKLLKSYEKNLYVETLSGARRRGPMTKNEIINHPIQGTAAHIVCAGMTALSELSFELDNPYIHPALNVHDDLSEFLSDDDATFEHDLELIAREMCKHRFDYINVPLVVEASIGMSWHELQEIKVYRSDVLFNLPNPYKEN